jgi:hypothetical protein
MLTRAEKVEERLLWLGRAVPVFVSIGKGWYVMSLGAGGGDDFGWWRAS